MFRFTIRELALAMVIATIGLAVGLLYCLYLGMPANVYRLALQVLLYSAPMVVATALPLLFAIDRLKRSSIPLPIKYIWCFVLVAVSIAAMNGFWWLLGPPKW